MLIGDKINHIHSAKSIDIVQNSILTKNLCFQLRSMEQ